MEDVNGLDVDSADAQFEKLAAPGDAGDADQDPDPAASFLAREQEQLAGIAAELDYVNELADAAHLDAREDDGDFDASPALSGRMDRQGEEEPEKIKKWREEQKVRLEQKDAEEEVKKQEMREAAKKELEDWYANHEDQIGKTKAANRNAEKQFVAESDEMEPGTEWERIAKLCDFNPKSTKSSKDVSRMRSIILQLKQSGTVPKKG